MCQAPHYRRKATSAFINPKSSDEEGGVGDRRGGGVDSLSSSLKSPRVNGGQDAMDTSGFASTNNNNSNNNSKGTSSCQAFDGGGGGGGVDEDDDDNGDDDGSTTDDFEGERFEFADNDDGGVNGDDDDSGFFKIFFFVLV